MATPTLVQKAKNAIVYPTAPVQVVLPAAATAGNCLVIAVEAAKVTDPFTISQMAAGAFRIDGSTLVTPAPVVKDNLNNTFTAIESFINFDGDLGYYSTIYLYYAANIAGNNRTFTVTNQDANGRPTFDHGINVQVYEFSGVAAVPLDGHKSALSAANPAVAGAITMTATGNLIIMLAHSRKTSTALLPAGYTMLDSDRIAGTGNDYFVIGYANGVLSSASATITNVALTTNVVTITAANTFQVGASVKLSGLTTATFLNNQTLTVASASGTQFTAAFTHADYASAADTGTAVGGPANLPSGSYNPGFVNPNQSKVAVATLALKHS